jgi:Tetraacyldisaccharide-1-P 4''-kinase
MQIKKSLKFPVPIVCVGNITVGGTGKTPFTEMIIRELETYNTGKFEIMVLSRGYRRKSKGVFGGTGWKVL